MPRRLAPPLASLLLGAALSCVGGGVRAEPPIRSAEDGLCRLEARARVFTAPNPRGLELETIGRGIYAACMSRFQGSAPRKRHRRHRRR